MGWQAAQAGIQHELEVAFQMTRVKMRRWTGNSASILLNHPDLAANNQTHGALEAITETQQSFNTLEF